MAPGLPELAQEQRRGGVEHKRLVVEVVGARDVALQAEQAREACTCLSGGRADLRQDVPRARARVRRAPRPADR